MARRQVVTPTVVTKPNGKIVHLQAKRWHVLEVLAKAYGWQRVAELGVFRAWTMLHLLNTCPDLTVIGVDAYRQPEGEGAERYDADMDALYREVCAALASFSNRAALIRRGTLEARRDIPDHHLDAVFIDADHRTDRVDADIRAWFTAVRPGGWLLGHDYHYASVRAAVRNHFYGDAVLFPDNVWGMQC